MRAYEYADIARSNFAQSISLLIDNAGNDKCLLRSSLRYGQASNDYPASLLDLVYGFWVLCMSATASVFISKAGGTASTSRQ